jgi:peptidoglycan/LPS O-acetylase OafA/YrhL
MRALAVLSVIIFHSGYLPNGFLGVDIFFVISGYLITGILQREVESGHFSLANFYLRRIRRILPLTLLVTALALALGIKTMLPDDLENLSQSIIATNFFGNNILQALTVRNYWDIANEYKPLMHTWSLGVEEQYYFGVPIVFFLIIRKRPELTLKLLTVVCAASLAAWLAPGVQDFIKFYHSPFRFWELCAGGLSALTLGRTQAAGLPRAPMWLAMTALLVAPGGLIPKELSTMACVLLSALLLTPGHRDWVTLSIISQPWVVYIGKISFSLYMWHQLVLAYGRYVWKAELTGVDLMQLLALTFVLSAASYRWIEQPFRDKRRIGTPTVLGLTSATTAATTAFSAYIYLHAGVLHDVPEMNIEAANAQRNMHAVYNQSAGVFDREFQGTPGATKVLVIGNSFGRDWINVILLSKAAAQADISYVELPDEHPQLRSRVQQADVIFTTSEEKGEIDRYKLPRDKTWVIGVKNFGVSNGYFYNHRADEYLQQRTALAPGLLEKNETIRTHTPDHYLDLIGKVIDKDRKVPVFTPDGRFISQDCRHFTKAGAGFYAELFAQQLSELIPGKPSVSRQASHGSSEPPETRQEVTRQPAQSKLHDDRRVDSRHERSKGST